MSPEYDPIELHYFAPPRQTPRQIWEERQRDALARAAEYALRKQAVAEAERMVREASDGR